MSTLAIFVLIVVFPTSKVGTSHFIDRDNAFEEILNNEDFSRFGYLTISSTLDILKFFYGKKNSLQLYNLVKTQLAETDPASGDCVKIYNKTFVYLPDLTPSSYYLLTSRESYFLQPFVVVFVATVFEPFEYAEFSPDKVYLTDSEYEASGHRWYKLSESYVRSLVDLIDDEDLATEICAQDPTGTCMPNKVKSWIYQQNKDLVFETFAGLLQVTTLLYNGDGREPSIRETSSAALNALNLMQSDCMSTSYLHRSELISAGSLAGKVFGDSLQMSKLFTSFNNRSASYAAHNNGSMLSCPKLDVNNSTTSEDTQTPWVRVTSTCHEFYSLNGSAATEETLVCNGKTGLWEPSPTPCLQMCAKLDVKNILMIDGGFDQYETAQGSGIKVTVTCKDGFLINQSLQKSIYAECDNGEWKPFTPACFPGCTSLIATNGNVEGDVDGMPMQSANTELRLTCNDNYTVNELGIRVINVTCINGSWSPFIPRCELGCFGLDVENSIRNYTDVVSGAFVDIFCIENFTINGGDELKATISCENGVWKPQLPRCLPKCPPVEVRQGNISGGINIQTNLQLAETEVNITCINGYTINGTLNDTTFIKCSNGWWFPGIPWCEHSCSAPFVENGAIFGTLGSLEDSQPSRTVLLIKCWNGYSINGTRENETSVLCINGTWTPALPYCSKMCRSLSIAQANFVGGFSPMTNYQPSLTLIVVTCWSSESFYMLCEEGNWNQSIPICNGFKHDLAVAVDQRLLQFEFAKTKDFLMALLYQLPVSDSFNQIALLSFCDDVHIDKMFMDHMVNNDHSSLGHTMENMIRTNCNNPNYDKLLQTIKTIFDKEPGSSRACVKFKTLILTGLGNIDLNETAATKYAQLLARGNILNRFVTINGGTDDNYQATLEHIFGLGSYADFASVDLLDLDIVTGQSMLDLNSPNPPEPSYGKNCCEKPTSWVDRQGEMICKSLNNTVGCFSYKEEGAATSNYHCVCKRGYFCQHCDHVEDSCDPVVVRRYCETHLTCVSCNDCGTSPPVRCGCPIGYQTDWEKALRGGLQCDQDVNECEDDEFKCKNNGTCVNTIGSFHCICPAHFVGKQCEMQANCEDPEWVQCGLNAECTYTITEGELGSCQCKNGFQGHPYIYCGTETLPKVHATIDSLGNFVTFDGLTFTYNGSCPVTLLRKSALKGFHEIPDFMVVITPSLSCVKIQNGICYRGTSEINIIIGTHKIRFVATTSNIFYFDGLPETESVLAGDLSVYYDSNKNLYVETGDAMLIDIKVGSSDSTPTLDIGIANSSAYNGRIAGMMGNFNSIASDDIQTATGSHAESSGEMGDSYIAENFGSFNSTSCLPSFFLFDRVKFEWSAQTKCKFLSDREGPFALCYQHLKSHEIYQAYVNCLFTISNLYSQLETANKHACDGPLTDFASRCREVAYDVNVAAVRAWKWRKETGCIMDCPKIKPNSMYCTMHPACANSCSFTCASQMCQETYRVEGCFCYHDEYNGIRFVENGDGNSTCVPFTSCNPDDDTSICRGFGAVKQSGHGFSRKDTDFDDGCDLSQKPSQLQ